MRHLTHFMRFVGGVIVVGVLSALGATELDRRSHHATLLVLEIAGAVLALWLAVALVEVASAYLTGGRYAVEALILNDANELLMYRHPHHRCMLPPGGRVKRREFPNDALQRRLLERVGLRPQDYEFVCGDVGTTDHLGEIKRYAPPFLVQRELHKQRSLVRFHYDFIYVLRLCEPRLPNVAANYEPICFVNLTQVEAMVGRRETLPDVLDAYARALRAIGETA